MSKLVLAEKPSVAQALSKVLGATRRGDGYLDANVKHFFTLLGKMFFTSYGKEFFIYHGKQIFTSQGKHLFTRYGKQTLSSAQPCG